MRGPALLRFVLIRQGGMMRASLHDDTLPPPTGEVGESAPAEKPGIPGCLGRERHWLHASYVLDDFLRGFDQPRLATFRSV